MQSPNTKDNEFVKVNILPVDEKRFSPRGSDGHKLDFTNVVEYDPRNVGQNDPRESI